MCLTCPNVRAPRTRKQTKADPAINPPDPLFSLFKRYFMFVDQLKSGPVQTPNFSSAEPNTLNQVHEKLGVWIIGTLSQFGTAQRFFPPISARNFDLGSTLERLWFRRRTFMYRTKCINYYNVFILCSLIEMNIFLLLNLVRLELRSASESIQPV